MTGLQQAEADAKQMLSNLAWSGQIVEKAAAHADQFPSQWQWAKPFLEQYYALLKDFKMQLGPGDHGSEDLTEFLDALKLAVLDKGGLKKLKKDHKDRYEANLALVVDRSKTTTAQLLA